MINLEELSTDNLKAELHRLAVIWNQAEQRKAELMAELEKRGVKVEAATAKGGAK